MKTILTTVFAAALSLAACGADPSVMDGYKSDTPKPAASQTGHAVEVSSAFIVPPFSGRTTSAGFMTLQNKGADARLISASSPISETVEIHNHIEDNGVMKMRRVDGIALPHGKSVDLKPGSFHVMIFDTQVALGDEAVLTLDFEKADDLTVVAPVVTRGEKMSGDKDHGSHSGH